MRIKLNKSIALLLTLILIAVSALIFAVKIATISLPKNFTEDEIQSVSDTVKAYCNQFGIPHIIAKNENDAYFMMGYFHARDRLWQMDLMRRSGRGQLSEIFGEETINVDKFFKCLRLDKIADKIYNNTDKNIRDILSSYSSGVNYFIKKNRRKLPFEFQTLEYIPKDWTPTDCMIVGKMLAYDMSTSFLTDIVMGEISEKIGVAKALTLLADYPVSGPCVTDDSIYKTNNNKSLADSVKKVSSVYEYEKGYSNSLSSVFELIKDTRKFAGISDAPGGSNSWVVKKSRENGSGVIIANDPHMQFGLPAKWYQVHLTYPQANLTGLTIPGIPFMMVGRNDYIAWGITNVMLDDCDFFFEKVDSVNSNLYYTISGVKKKFIFKADTIKIKNKEAEQYYTRFTDRSAVISDFHPISNPKKLYNFENDNSGKNFLIKYCLTYSWTGSLPSYEFKALYQLTNARDWGQFTIALNQWCAPALNFTYADTKGNMGIYPAGRIPIRKLCNPSIPNPGWLPGYDWEGTLTAEAFPKTYNPKKGFVASANNKTSRSFPTFLSHYFEVPSRAERINDILQNQKEFSVRDVQLMQADCYSPYARDLMKIALLTLNNNKKKLSDEQRAALEVMNKWDFIFSPVTVAPAIYTSFYQKFVYNTFIDELGETLYCGYVYSTYIPSMKILDMAQKYDTLWFDDVRTPWKEKLEDIVIKSFKDGVDELLAQMDENDINKCLLGKYQTIILNHTFSNDKFLKAAVTSGPYQAGGNYTTINKADAHLYDPTRIITGPSMRFIADMLDSAIYTGLPGGASGDPVSPNYTDQILLFLNSGYVRLNSTRQPSHDCKLTVIFNPAR